MVPYTDASLQKGFRLAVCICCIMIGNAFMFAGVVESITVRHAPLPDLLPSFAAAYERLRYLLPGVAVVILALIPWWRSRILATTARAGAIGAGLPERVIRVMRVSMVSCALCLAVALYGLTLYLATGDRQQFYLQFALALTAFAVHFPRRARWRAWLQEMEEEHRHLPGKSDPLAP